MSEYTRMEIANRTSKIYVKLAELSNVQWMTHNEALMKAELERELFDLLKAKCEQ